MSFSAILWLILRSIRPARPPEISPEPVQPAVKCPGFVKVYFMGFSDKGSRQASVQDYLSFLKEQYCVLKMICKEAENVEVSESSKEIFNYQACVGSLRKRPL